MLIAAISRIAAIRFFCSQEVLGTPHLLPSWWQCLTVLVACRTMTWVRTLCCRATCKATPSVEGLPAVMVDVALNPADLSPCGAPCSSIWSPGWQEQLAAHRMCCWCLLHSSEDIQSSTCTPWCTRRYFHAELSQHFWSTRNTRCRL